MTSTILSVVPNTLQLPSHSSPTALDQGASLCSPQVCRSRESGVLCLPEDNVRNASFCFYTLHQCPIITDSTSMPILWVSHVFRCIYLYSHFLHPLYTKTFELTRSTCHHGHMINLALIRIRICSGFPGWSFLTFLPAFTGMYSSFFLCQRSDNVCDCPIYVMKMIKWSNTHGLHVW